MDDKRAPAALGEDRLGDANREGVIDSPRETLGDRGETKKSSRQNPRELDDARYAALDCRAHSEQARALVTTLTNLVAEHELTAGTRTNKRKKKQAALSSAVERLLADLLLVQTLQKTKGYVYRSMRPERFTESEVSYRVFRALVGALVDLGFLENHKGFQHWRESFGGQLLPMIAKASRFRASLGGDYEELQVSHYTVVRWRGRALRRHWAASAHSQLIWATEPGPPGSSSSARTLSTTEAQSPFVPAGKAERLDTRANRSDPAATANRN